jgi:hypothetical protein
MPKASGLAPGSHLRTGAVGYPEPARGPHPETAPEAVRVRRIEVLLRILGWPLRRGSLPGRLRRQPQVLQGWRARHGGPSSRLPLLSLPPRSEHKNTSNAKFLRNGSAPSSRAWRSFFGSCLAAASGGSLASSGSRQKFGVAGSIPAASSRATRRFEPSPLLTSGGGLPWLKARPCPARSAPTAARCSRRSCGRTRLGC